MDEDLSHGYSFVASAKLAQITWFPSDVRKLFHDSTMAKAY
jgi:hypothetical protein